MGEGHLSQMERDSGHLLDCRLCGGHAKLVYSGFPGYQAPARYDIYSCPRCESSFAEPCEVSESIYEHIYKQRWSLPGYNQYALQAMEVCRAKGPLTYLVNRSYVYRGVSDYLAGLGHKGQLRILEIGSGLGYFTYALARAGYLIRGIDVSEKAVLEARRWFGDLFECSDLKSLGERVAGQHDVVLALELIEHIPDVHEFMKAAKTLLSREGRLIITTPNRGAYGQDAVWRTEAPPVHLWWFSERSMEVLACQTGLISTRYGLSHYDNAIFPPEDPVSDDVLLNVLPRLSETGAVCFPGHRVLAARFLAAYYLERLHLLEGARRWRSILLGTSPHRHKSPPRAGRRETVHLCTVFLGEAGDQTGGLLCGHPSGAA